LLLPPDALPPAVELLVTLDANLHAIPFSALALPAETDDYTPVIGHYTVKIVPSFSTFLMRKPAKPAHSIELAVFADPQFSEPRTKSAMRGWTQQLQHLPASTREAQFLTTLLPARDVRVYSRTAATRDNLSSTLVRNAKVLHIASHGYFFAAAPDNVGLALAPANSRDGTDSGFVTLADLSEYRSNHQLVVISGCDTALGQAQGGEGMMSVTRGFIAQGALHVVSTLWEVSDRASADFMHHFYTKLMATHSVATALRDTQDTFRKSAQYADPFFWAAYMLTSVAADDQVRLHSQATAQPPDLPRSKAGHRRAS
jgi:CHAT domain-containing protein